MKKVMFSSLNFNLELIDKFQIDKFQIEVQRREHYLFFHRLQIQLKKCPYINNIPYFTTEAPTLNKHPLPILAKKSCVGLIASN